MKNHFYHSKQSSSVKTNFCSPKIYKYNELDKIVFNTLAFFCVCKIHTLGPHFAIMYLSHSQRSYYNVHMHKYLRVCLYLWHLLMLVITHGDNSADICVSGLDIRWFKGLWATWYWHFSQSKLIFIFPSSMTSTFIKARPFQTIDCISGPKYRHL